MAVSTPIPTNLNPATFPYSSGPCRLHVSPLKRAIRFANHGDSTARTRPFSYKNPIQPFRVCKLLFFFPFCGVSIFIPHALSLLRKRRHDDQKKSQVSTFSLAVLGHPQRHTPEPEVIAHRGSSDHFPRSKSRVSRLTTCPRPAQQCLPILLFLLAVAPSLPTPPPAWASAFSPGSVTNVDDTSLTRPVASVSTRSVPSVLIWKTDIRVVHLQPLHRSSNRRRLSAVPRGWGEMAPQEPLEVIIPPSKTQQQIPGVVELPPSIRLRQAFSTSMRVYMISRTG